MRIYVILTLQRIWCSESWLLWVKMWLNWSLILWLFFKKDKDAKNYNCRFHWLKYPNTITYIVNLSPVRSCFILFQAESVGSEVIIPNCWGAIQDNVSGNTGGMGFWSNGSQRAGTWVIVIWKLWDLEFCCIFLIAVGTLLVTWWSLGRRLQGQHI